MAPLLPGSSSIVHGKAMSHVRHDTPDSEVLASSDDEQEQNQIRRLSSNQLAKGSRPTLRSVDSYSNRQANPTSLGNEILQTSEPVSEGRYSNDLWTSGSTNGRMNTTSASSQWPVSIWNDPLNLTSIRRKETYSPSRGSGPFVTYDEMRNTSKIRHDNTTNTGIPFAIPLQPTLKTYRSQSYSVGQKEAESTPSPGLRPGIVQHAPPSRAGAHYGAAQRRLSRPTTHGDFPHESTVLEQLREVEDDYEEESLSSEAGIHIHGNQKRTTRRSTIENLLLRQGTISDHNPHIAQINIRPKSNTRPGMLEYLTERGHPPNDMVVDETDDIYGLESVSGTLSNTYLPRGRTFRGHESSGSPRLAIPTGPDNRALENVKKAHWSSSLDFGGIGEIPQSRRHSFADIIPRHNPKTFIKDSSRESMGDSGPGQTTFGHGDGYPQHRDSVASFLSATDPRQLFNTSFRGGHGDETVAPAYLGLSNQRQAAIPSNTYRTHSFEHTVHLVTFKAARAEFYCVQEGTGLQLKAGDLVIVEADRGTDLGTVAHANVDPRYAKELKERYIEEHYRWLMMFSRHGQIFSSTKSDLSSNGVRHSVPSLGTPGAVYQDVVNSDLKPKMVKRLAQTHEIQILRDKEANEAKAKRTCQQKVIEHHLNMEILDAEFQMDWKKLTFYYFADTYINFNPLVTDLFKIYKTRIWMSAVNPASFANQAATVQAPTILGPGAVLAVDHDHTLDQPFGNHHRNQVTEFQLEEGSSAKSYDWFGQNQGQPTRPFHAMAADHLYPLSSVHQTDGAAHEVLNIPRADVGARSSIALKSQHHNAGHEYSWQDLRDLSLGS